MRKYLLLSISLLAQASAEAPLSQKFYTPSAVADASSSQAADIPAPFMQALVSTYDTNPELRSSVRQLFATAEDQATAAAGWRPQVTATGSVSSTYQDLMKSGRTFQSSLAEGRYDTRNGTAGVEISQNLFRGGQTIAEVKAAEMGTQAQLFFVTSTEQKQLSAAIAAYMQLWFEQAQLRLTKANEEAFERQLAQTQAGLEVGENSATNLAEVQFRYTDAVAQRLNSEATLKVAESNYEKIVGLPAPTDVVLPPSAKQFEAFPTSLQDLKSTAMDSNPEVLRAVYSEKAQSASEEQAEGTLLPSLDLKGNAARSITNGGQSDLGNPFGVGTLSSSRNHNNSMSAQLTLTVPIYQGGANWSRLRKARQNTARAKYDVVTTKRAAVDSAIQAWQTYQAALKRVEQFKKQVEAGEIQLEGLQQANLAGERTLLDVLNTQRDLTQAQLNLAQAQRDHIISSYNLLQAQGRLTAKNLNLPVELYNLQEYVDTAATQIIGLEDTPERHKDTPNVG